MIKPSSSVHDVPDFLAPSTQAQRLPDVDHGMMANVGEMLELEYLARNDNDAVYPVPGVLYSLKHMIMVSAICRTQSLHGERGPPVNVVFAVDTSSPYTYVSRRAGLVLFERAPMNCFDLNIHGRVTEVYTSPSDANVLGMNYIAGGGLSIGIDYATKGVLLAPWRRRVADL